jgi:hypothetical protein
MQKRWQVTTKKCKQLRSDRERSDGKDQRKVISLSGELPCVAPVDSEKQPHTAVPFESLVVLTLIEILNALSDAVSKLIVHRLRACILSCDGRTTSWALVGTYQKLLENSWATDKNPIAQQHLPAQSPRGSEALRFEGLQALRLGSLEVPFGQFYKKSSKTRAQNEHTM